MLTGIVDITDIHIDYDEAYDRDAIATELVNSCVQEIQCQQYLWQVGNYLYIQPVQNEWNWGAFFRRNGFKWVAELKETSDRARIQLYDSAVDGLALEINPVGATGD